jgi:urease
LEAALYGSFLPVPKDDMFPAVTEEHSSDKTPGAVIARKDRIAINQNRQRVQLKVTNNGDRPIQVCTYTSV